MIGPVAHIGKRITYFAFQRTIHELAEGDMSAVVIMTVAQDEIHRDIECPFDIVGKTKVLREDERQNARALIVGIAPDIRTPGQQAVRLAFREGRTGEKCRCHRLQFHRNLHLAAHVPFRAEVQIYLNGRCAVHHVQTFMPHFRHVVGHDLVARFRHDGGFGQSPFRTAANA